MESTAARRPPANDEGVCGMFINLFRRQRPALARLARNSNAYRQPMVASVSSSAVGVSSITSKSGTFIYSQINHANLYLVLTSPLNPTQPPQPAYPRWMPPSAASTTSRSRP